MYGRSSSDQVIADTRREQSVSSITTWPILILVASSFATCVHAADFLANGVTAHRGNSGEFPENTIPAFKSGIDVGADWLELDIFRTKDDKLVVIHDRTTERVGDRDLEVAKSSYEELLTIGVATEFRRKHNLSLDQCPRQTAPLRLPGAFPNPPRDDSWS